MNVDLSYSWFFLLLLIPIAIHFLNFVRTKKVYFSKVQFISYVKDQRNKIESVKRLVLLITRCLLFIALIVSFFTINSSTEDESTKEILFIDNTPSSSFKQNNVSVLDLEVNYLNQSSSEEKEIALNTASFDKKGLYFSKSNVADRLIEVVTDFNSFTLSKVKDRVSNVLTFSELNAEEVGVTVVSDFQKNMDLSALANSPYKVNLVKVGGTESYPNVVIDSLWLGSKFVSVNQKSSLFVAYHQLGESDEVTLKLLINGTQSGFVTLPTDRKTGVLEIPFSLQQAGISVCQLVLDDAVDFDNEYNFVISSDETINVGVIVEDTLKSFVGKVFVNEEIFKTHLWSIKNLPFDQLVAMDILIFEGNKSNNKGMADLLDNLTKKGVLLVYVPANTIEHTTEIDTWFLEQLQGKVLTVSNKQKLSTYDETFLSGVFEGANKSFDYPTVTPKIGYNKTLKALLSLNDKSAFLVQKNAVFGFSTAFSDSLTNFHKHSLFVPAFYKLAFQSSKSNTELAHFIGNDIALDLKLGVDETLLFKRAETELAVSFTINDLGKVVVDGSTEGLTPGYYDVMVRDSVLTKVALNGNKAESETNFYSLEDLESTFEGSNVTVQAIEDQTSIDKTISAKNEGIPFWKYSLTLALVLLLIEIIVIKYWR